MREHGKIPNSPAAFKALAVKLASTGRDLRFCYEAGPCGYGIQRQLAGMGHDCAVVAPPLIPRKPGERIKTDWRDAINLAKLHRAGELTPGLGTARRSAISSVHFRRRTALCDKLASNCPASCCATAITTIGRPGRSCTDDGWQVSSSSSLCITSCWKIASRPSRRRRHGDEAHIEAALPKWSLASVVQALQALPGMGLVAAATLVAELGDITRFTNPRQLMAYLGLVPSEHSSGGTRRQGGITKAGNGAARRMLIEAAWSYRFPARISREQLLRQESLAKPIRDIAWKAQKRLCRRYRKLARAGKLPTAITVTVAVARELAGFIWAIAKQAQPTAP